MRKVKDKEDALKYLDVLMEDFEMLRDGDWVPDEKSCEASIEVLQAVINFMEGMK